MPPKGGKEVKMDRQAIEQICEQLLGNLYPRHIEEEEEFLEALESLEAQRVAEPAPCWDGQRAWYFGDWLIVSDEQGIYVDRRRDFGEV
jgi:hypothetical protein